MAITVIPHPYFDESQSRAMLEKTCQLTEQDRVFSRYVKNRNFHLSFAVSEEMEDLKDRFSGEVKILHASECLLSLADQVKSSDHQRGLVVCDIQAHTLDILVIKEDKVKLLNRYILKDPLDFLYYTLNTMNKLKLDRESVPVYHSGIIHEDHELNGLLGKYIRHVHHIPYYLEELSRDQMLRFMILSEGSKCA